METKYNAVIGYCNTVICDIVGCCNSATTCSCCYDRCLIKKLDEEFYHLQGLLLLLLMCTHLLLLLFMYTRTGMYITLRCTVCVAMCTEVYITSRCIVCTAKMYTEDKGKNTTTPKTQRERHNCKKRNPKTEKVPKG